MNTKISFETRFPAAAGDATALLVALDDMIEIASRGGEECFHFVCGAVWAIKRMAAPFGYDSHHRYVSPSSLAMAATLAAARQLYSDQELDDIGPVSETLDPAVEPIPCLCPVLHMTGYPRCHAKTHLMP